MYNPFIFELDTVSNINIKGESKEDVILSSTISYPLFSLGFNHFLHPVKSDFNLIKKKLETKNQFYYIVNPFELTITNYEDTILNQTKIYLKSKKDFTRTFYKMWELLFLFDIGNKKTLSYHIMSSGTDIEEAITLFRDKFISGSCKESKTNVDLIICDEQNINTEEDTRFEEQESYLLIIKEIIKALSCNNKDGHFVLRIFESFTNTTIKLIYLVSSFYEEVFLYKPYFSRLSDSERYIIFKKFKVDKPPAIVKTLEKILNSVDNKKYIYDILPDLVVPSTYYDWYKFINIKIANNQQNNINMMLTYIKENNYYGEKYHTFRENTIEATLWWVSNFFPPSQNLYEKNKEDFNARIKAVKLKVTMEKNKLITNMK